MFHLIMSNIDKCFHIFGPKLCPNINITKTICIEKSFVRSEGKGGQPLWHSIDSIAKGIEKQETNIQN